MWKNGLWKSQGSTWNTSGFRQICWTVVIYVWFESASDRECMVTYWKRSAGDSVRDKQRSKNQGFYNLIESPCPRRWTCRARALSGSRIQCILSLQQQRLVRLIKHIKFQNRMFRDAVFERLKCDITLFRSGHRKEMWDCGCQVQLSKACHVNRTC